MGALAGVVLCTYVCTYARTMYAHLLIIAVSVCKYIHIYNLVIIAMIPCTVSIIHTYVRVPGYR